ncbi:MAG: hypothetical protein AMS25_03505 [Gemmatimonas sp. SM23_52]|nr:MAG: hypothetical protein AMS25_03505 [Gemmatimonas sp. SM23_52]
MRLRDVWRPSGTRGRSLAVVAIVSFSVGAAILLRIEAMSAKYVITRDEAISYLSATCHQGAYQQKTADFEPRPVPAAQWKTLFRRVERPFCFGRISADLRRTDIHPPLYFWMLHAWSLLVGVELWTGPSLNVLIAVLATLSLFGLAAYSLRSDWDAALVVFTYALSPAVVFVSLEARQYDLLGLWAVLVVWQLLRHTDPARRPRARDGVLLAALTLGGALTHYHFIILLTACVVYAVVQLHARDRRRLAATLVALASGYALSWLIHPALSAPSRAAQQNQGFNLASLPVRWGAVVWSFRSFTYVGVLLLVLLILALALYLIRRDVLISRLRTVDRSGAYAPFFFLWTASATVFLYLAFLSPAHAMSPKYLAMAWPFLAFFPVFIARLIPPRALVTLLLYLAPLVVATGFRARVRQVEQNAPPLSIPRVDTVVLDNTARAVLPRLLWHVPEEQPVIAGMQDSLLRHSDEFLGHLGDTSLFVSVRSFGNTEARLTELLARVSQAGYRVYRIEGGVLALGPVFRLEREQD